MPSAVNEQTLTLQRYRHGGWETYLVTLSAFAEPGESFTIQLEGFTPDEEAEVVMDLLKEVSLGILPRAFQPPVQVRVSYELRARKIDPNPSKIVLDFVGLKGAGRG